MDNAQLRVMKKKNNKKIASLDKKNKNICHLGKRGCLYYSPGLSKKSMLYAIRQLLRNKNAPKWRKNEESHYQIGRDEEWWGWGKQWQKTQWQAKPKGRLHQQWQTIRNQVRKAFSLRACQVLGKSLTHFQKERQHLSAAFLRLTIDSGFTPRAICVILFYYLYFTFFIHSKS